MKSKLKIYLKVYSLPFLFMIVSLLATTLMDPVKVVQWDHAGQKF